MDQGTLKSILSIVFFLFGSLCTFTFAQSEETSHKNILEVIENESEGNVEFDIPEKIADKIFSVPTTGKKNTQTGTGNAVRPKPSKAQGFRIQVFCDGGNQSSLQARAKARCNAIASRFPKYRGQVYTFSSAPNWYGRVGNFKSQAEANAALAELKRAFPAFAGEMRVVKSQITTR